MFTKILIANRGEIACRIIRTARAMGVSTVAVYSEADADALHVRMADETVLIGAAPVAESYLRGDKIIAAAVQTGAEAIHPGYGFLSENPDFVEAVEAKGIVFIGPSAKAIRAMGLKDAAKALMQKAGVPVVPGYHGAGQDGLAAEAAKIGYPVLIKAVAGGGGKGMRRVDAPDQFAEALASAKAEARTAFGNEAVLIEKYVTAPRHIEVQVFGDGTRAVHLFERDCSLQRRHQKVIEEAPAPGMTEAMRAAMGQAAVRAAEAIGYKGAGTVEFIVDGSEGLRPDRFWFMEMNTRLQVEHPVTEAITGVDLVEWQLRVAAGEPLPLTQDQLAIRGHAFEARLYAEDVPAGFLPAPGQLSHLRFPVGVRADTGVEAGSTISPWYDPMIAKIIVHGSDRASALTRMATVLDQTEVAGTKTNIGLLRSLSRHAGFAAGDVDTGLIERDFDGLTAPAKLPARDLAQAVLTLAGLSGPPDPFSGFSLWAPLDQSFDLLVDGDPVVARISAPVTRQFSVSWPGAHVICVFGPGGWTYQGDPPAPCLVEPGRRVTFFAGGHVVEAVDPCVRADVAGPAGDRVLAPMPGMVTEIFVSPGQAVCAGDRIAVMEAMKMEHTLRAPRNGVVLTIPATAGKPIEAGASVAELEPEA